MPGHRRRRQGPHLGRRPLQLVRSADADPCGGACSPNATTTCGCSSSAPSIPASTRWRSCRSRASSPRELGVLDTRRCSSTRPGWSTTTAQNYLLEADAGVSTHKLAHRDHVRVPHPHPRLPVGWPADGRHRRRQLRRAGEARGARRRRAARRMSTRSRTRSSTCCTTRSSPSARAATSTRVASASQWERRAASRSPTSCASPRHAAGPPGPASSRRCSAQLGQPSTGRATTSAGLRHDAADDGFTTCGPRSAAALRSVLRGRLSGRRIANRRPG